MPDRMPQSLDASQQRQMALSRWDNEGGAGAGRRQGGLISGAARSDTPELTNTEFVQLRVRAIALENLMITLLAGSSYRHLQLFPQIPASTSPRPHFTHH